MTIPDDPYCESMIGSIPWDELRAVVVVEEEHAPPPPLEASPTVPTSPEKKKRKRVRKSKVAETPALAPKPRDEDKPKGEDSSPRKRARGALLQGGGSSRPASKGSAEIRKIRRVELKQRYEALIKGRHYTPSQPPPPEPKRSTHPDKTKRTNETRTARYAHVNLMLEWYEREIRLLEPPAAPSASS